MYAFTVLRHRVTLLTIGAFLYYISSLIVGIGGNS